MAITSTSVQRPTPQARRRQPAFAQSFGPKSRPPFEPPNALSAALIKSLRKSRRTHCSRSGEPPSDRHSREPAQDVAPNKSDAGGRPCGPAPGAYIEARLFIPEIGNASLRPRGGDLPRIYRRRSPERGEGRPDRPG